MTTSPRLTQAATGRVRCPGCDRSFTATRNMPTVETVAMVENVGRIDSVGQRHRGIGTHEVTRIWHAACLADFNARNDAYRAKVERDRQDAIRAICEAHGLPLPEGVPRP